MPVAPASGDKYRSPVSSYFSSGYLPFYRMFRLTVMCLSETGTVTSLGSAGKFMHYGSVM